MSKTTSLDWSQCKPPRVAATDPNYQVFSAGAGAADLWGGYPADPVSGRKAPKGQVWLELTAVGGVMTFRFSRTNGTSGSLAATNGQNLKDGDRVKVLADPRIDLYMDVLGTGQLTWRRTGEPVTDDVI